MCLAAAAVTTPAAAYGRAGDPVAALDRDAHALQTTAPFGRSDDLRPLDAMIAAATVVGVGEATHNSREFFTVKHRIFRYLVEEKGFTTFSLETGWSGGLRLNEYVLHGRGDLRQIMREEFQGAYQFWRTAEYLDLIEWMRQHNARYGTRLQFMGNDLGYAGPELFDLVTGYVASSHPTLLARFVDAYRGLRPTTDAGTWMSTYPGLPLQQRQATAAKAQQALAALAAVGAGTERHAWMVQHARAITQVATAYAFDLEDPARIPDAMRYRDQVMAENTIWWQQQTGGKVLLSAHNGHVGYESADPDRYPKVQGAFLREQLGARYVSIGFTFHHGSFNAQDENDEMGRFSVGPPRVDSNEHTLDRVAPRDYLLDMRGATPAARLWLQQARPTRAIGTGWPESEKMTALAATYDILIHLHRIHAAKLLP